jgi:tetratricopeptide (TPR) repeat protein
MELNDNVYAQILTLAEEGDEFAENEIYGSAVSKYQLALELLPEPKLDWEAATWLYVALGDAFFSQKDYDAALDAYELALQSPEGTGNPYIWFCIGEVFFEQNNLEKAKTHFMSAYMLDGDEIFKDANPNYLALIAAEIS